MLLQIAIPQNIFAEEENNLPQDKYTTVGKIDFKSFDTKTMIEMNKVAAKNRKTNSKDKGSTLFSPGPYFGDDNEPTDENKLKYYGNVKAKLTVKGLNDGEFQWNEIFGVDKDGNPNPAQLIFTQINDETGAETGVERYLKITEEGIYAWTDGDGEPAELPLFNNKFEPFFYEVRIDEDVAEKVQLLTATLFGSDDASPTFEKPDAEGRIKFNLVLDLTLQQVTSTKFTSEWFTGLDEENRPQIQADATFSGVYMGKVKSKNLIIDLPKNDTDEVIVRDREDTGDPKLVIAERLNQDPQIVIKKDTLGLNFEEADGVKTVKSGDHKFKYDFTYDVINGGKLTMTEIIPVTFDANGGKFASITEEGAEQKIVKEVEYKKDLTKEVEKPKKERETFKGWATEAKGKALSDEEFNKAIKNLKAAKTFYAVWDNNDIQAEELTVNESFKEGDTWVNDFIPTLDQLKGQVKIKDASGKPQELADDDKIEILDDSGNPISDENLKDKLYEKLKEDDTTEVSRDVTLKAKITHKNGTSQTVDIPIKVIKNIYEAKTEEGKPNYVPDGYVKVTVDPTTKAKDPQKYFYYVNPDAKVVIPGTDPTGTGDNKFVKWTYDDNGTETEYKLANKPRHQFKSETTITAQYVSDVIPANDNGSKPDTVPSNFVEVKFVPTDKAKDNTNKIFWVNPDKKVTIPVANPVAKAGFIFKEWKIGDVTTGETYTVGTPKKFENETTITATYTESENIIEYDPKNPTAKPDGYITVSFEADLGLKLKDVKYYFVKKNAKDTEDNPITLGSAALKKPGYQAANGYEFNGWDKPDTTPIGDQDIVVTALAKQASSPDKPGDEPGYRPSYPEIIYRDRIVEKEKIVEKIVKVGENDELLKEIRYMQGYNGKFRPYDGLTRAEAAQILANALKADGYRYDANYALSYTDVGNKWYTDAVRVVTQANVFQGYSDGTFRPQSKITRAEWVATLRRFQDLKEANGNAMMLRSGHWATAEVQAAYEAGWLGVYQDGTAHFDADKPITRQEVAYVSNRAFRRVLDKVYLRRSVNTLLTYKDINPSMPLYEDILCASNTLLTDNKYYKANTIVMDNVTFNIVTDYMTITQKKFQYNVNR